MPSKKKQSRTPSRLSNGEPPASPKTPASSTTSRDTVFVQILKDAVRISLNLCYGLGCPVSGRTVFVYPVSGPSLSDQFNGNGGSHNNDVNHLSLLACKELCLELTPFRNMLQAKNASESSHEQNGNGSSTPKTPSSLQKFSSPRPKSPASPIIEDSVFSTKQRSSSESSIDLREVLNNESSKKLLEICASSWLYPCSLLYGNFVAVPILSEICVFCVKRADKRPSDTSNRSHAFSINQETKVYLHHTLGLASEIRERTSVQGLQFDEDDERENVGCEISKLGGLSKEYAILRDIIVSSSTKNSLSRYCSYLRILTFISPLHLF